MLNNLKSQNLLDYSDGHSAATFLRHLQQAAAPLFFFRRKSGSASAPLSKYSAATANKLLPRCFRFTFSHVTAWSLYSPLIFTLLLLPRCFSLLEHTRLSLWRFVAPICIGEFYCTLFYFFWTKIERTMWSRAGQFELIKPISIKAISSSIPLTKMR